MVECVAQLLIEHGVCLSHEGSLIFPAFFPKLETGADDTNLRGIMLCYDFSGAIDNIYSGLVTSLALCEKFGRVRLSADRAEFAHAGEGFCGLRKVERTGGKAHLDLYFNEQPDPVLSKDFSDYVEDYLRREGVAITEIPKLSCHQCGYVLAQQLVQDLLNEGLDEVSCPRGHRTHILPVPIAAADQENEAAQMKLSAYKSDSRRQSAASIRKVTQTIGESPGMEESQEPLRVLHLSDIHIGPDTDPTTILQPLISDLTDKTGGFGLSRLDYLVISGDITNTAAPEEFELAYQFVSSLIERFKLSAQRCIIVPGNHDQSWNTPGIYDFKHKHQIPDIAKLKEGSYTEEKSGYNVRNDANYYKRFENFDRDFYHKLKQQEYPLKPEEQGLAIPFLDHRIQFLTFNSEYEVDVLFQERASVHPVARALAKADKDRELAIAAGHIAPDARVLRVAVWHHPVTGNEKIVEDAFLEQLRKADVKLCLHGHIHENRADLVGYLHPTRQLYIAGAGTFGALAKERPASAPNLYNLLEIERDLSRIRVHTRKRDKVGGAWKRNSIWPSDIPNTDCGYYDIKLK